MTVFKGGLTVSGAELTEADIVFGDGDEVVDAHGLIAAPGLIDTQINGAFGCDFTDDPGTIWSVGEQLVGTGVTAFLPTITSARNDVYGRAIDVVAAGPPASYRGAEVLGLHFEGPWLSVGMHGAHPLESLAMPDPATARDWVNSGVVRMVTMAPELPGATPAAEILDQGGVVVSIGHTDASYAEAIDALDGPFSSVTHLFNQMSGFHHRRPGVVAAAFDRSPHCGVIADLVHVSVGAIRMAWRLLGSDRLVLVSDAMAAMGKGEGEYLLGETTVTVDADGPHTADGRLAGSTLTLPGAIRNLSTATDATIAEALACASSTPAALLGCGTTGVTLFDLDLNVVATYVGGARVYG